MDTIKLTGHTLTLDQFGAVVYDHWKVEIDTQAKALAEKSKEILYKMIDDDTPVYGTNRGVGWNKDRKVFTESLDNYNRNLLRSHSLCIGSLCSEEEIRAILLIRLNCALYGCSGLSVSILERFCDFLNYGIHPCIPHMSSVGESDLAINAMIGMSMIGENDVFYQGKRQNSLDVMNALHMKPLVLGPKDGLGIASSNSQSCALTALLLIQAKKLLHNQHLIFCMAMEGLNGQLQQLDSSVTEAGGYSYQTEIAQICLHILENSYLKNTSRQKALQDPLSFRDYAYVSGCVLETLELIEHDLINQMNHSDDNPCVLPTENRVSVSCNFEPLNLVLKVEMLNIALSHSSKMSCQRILRLSDPAFTGLERFLSPDGGKTVIGYSTIQKTMMTLDVEIHSLAMPSSMDCMALSGSIEDHATNAVLTCDKTLHILDNLYYLNGIELMHAAQAIDLRGETSLGILSGTAFHQFRKEVPFLDSDRNLSIDIQKSYEILRDNKLLY